jgi:hypothetical protein
VIDTPISKDTIFSTDASIQRQILEELTSFF